MLCHLKTVARKTRNFDRKKSRLEFLKSLAHFLVEKHIKIGVANERLPRPLRTTIRNYLELKQQAPVSNIFRATRRCTRCPRNLDQNGRHMCTLCRKNMRAPAQHALSICRDCAA